MNMYLVRNHLVGQIAIIPADNIRTARRQTRDDYGSSASVLRRATAEDIAWYRAMGGAA